jgi:2-methylisocitrate lyase-like PEP mutase family enzyme
MPERLSQKEQAELFLGMHHGPQLLILPNCWDVVSARIFEQAGYKAVATTSAGVAATLGYPDGQKMSIGGSVDLVRRLTQKVRIPVSADIEAGYSASVDGVVDSAQQILDAGGVGINLEDSTGDAGNPLFDSSLQCEKLAAVREMADAVGIHLVINARTDVFLFSEGTMSQRLEEAIDRGNSYFKAGADCIFVPDVGDLDGEAISRLVKGISAPVNVIAGEHTPSIGELEEIGVARVSLGPRPMRATLGLLRRIADEILTDGTFRLMSTDTLTYAEVNAMFGEEEES